MPRGGRRNGKPGASYGNRRDLATQPVRTAPGQPYGAAGRQADAQRAVPLPATPAAAAAPTPQATPFAPPEPGLLSAPSARPGEPITSGLPVGAGAGPEAVAAGLGGGNNDQILANLYQAYKIAPSEGLRALINQAERLRVRPL